MDKVGPLRHVQPVALHCYDALDQHHLGVIGGPVDTSVWIIATVLHDAPQGDNVATCYAQWIGKTEHWAQTKGGKLVDE